MNIARIVRIEPDGKPFTTANGTFYPFVVGFDDHRSGQANSKSNPPPWKVSEIVGYEVTGQTPRGADKFKIKRNPDANDGTYNPPSGAEEHMEGDPLPPPPLYRPAPVKTAQPPPQARSVAQNRPSEHLPVNLPHGATVGGALARAVDIYLAMGQAADTGVRWDAPDIQFVEQITRDLVEIQGRIERGEPPANQPF